MFECIIFTSIFELNVWSNLRYLEDSQSLSINLSSFKPLCAIASHKLVMHCIIHCLDIAHLNIKLPGLSNPPFQSHLGTR